MITFKARLILENLGKILLLKQTSQNGGKHTLIGGNVELKEYAIDAIIRESMEEAGILLLREDLKLAHTLHKIKGGHHRIVLYFRAKKWEGTPESKEPKKFKNVDWFPINELPKNLSPTIKHVLKQYRRGNSYSEIKLI